MQWTERLKLKRISKWAILILAIVIVVFSLVTVYGYNVGNFVITIHDADNRGNAMLYIADTNDLEITARVVSLQGLREQADATKDMLPSAGDFVKGIGVKNDETKNMFYSAFSFWLVNKNETEIDYTYVFTLDQDRKALYEIARVWIIESDGKDTVVSGNGNGVVYRYPEATPELEDEYHAELDKSGGGLHYETEYFVSRTEICRVTRYGFQPHTAENFTAVKFTVVIWMEGCDPQCNDDKLDATLKASMDFYPAEIS